jgi:hypothetical protein
MGIDAKGNIDMLLQKIDRDVLFQKIGRSILQAELHVDIWKR